MQENGCTQRGGHTTAGVPKAAKKPCVPATAPNEDKKLNSAISGNTVLLPAAASEKLRANGEHQGHDARPARGT